MIGLNYDYEQVYNTLIMCKMEKKYHFQKSRYFGFVSKHKME